MSKPKPPADFDENPEWTDKDFAKAKPSSTKALLRGPGRPIGSTSSTKKQISLRVDEDTLAEFKSEGRGWQTRMNDALRTRVDVAYSRAVKGWLVTLVQPTKGVAGRSHHIIESFDTCEEAKEKAEEVAAAQPGDVQVFVRENA